MQRKVLKRIKLPGWIALFLIMILVGISFNQFIKKSEAVETVVANNEGWSKYPGIELQTETNEANTYTSSISKPTLKGEKVNQLIHSWLEEQEDDFLNSLKELEGNLNENFRAHLNIPIETEQVSQHLYNLIFRPYTFSGGANGLNTVKSFTINLEDDKVYNLDEIIDVENEDFLVELRKLIESQLNENENLSIYVDQDLLNEALHSLDELEWSINKKAFTVHFDEYEIAAGAAGAIEINIPIEKLTSFIDDNIAEELNITKEKDDPSKENTSQPPAENQDGKENEEEIQLDPNGKYVALTFDDGPSSKVTPRVLETLKEFDAVATFFMLGSQVDYYSELAKKVAENGHEIASHTESHKDLTKLSVRGIRQELATSRDKITKATGQVPTLVRPPYGAYNETVKKIAGENQESIILWSVDSLDWKSRNATAVNAQILKTIRPGSIVLMHDIHPSTADALPKLLSTLKEQGYEFVTVSQLLSLQNDQGVGPYYGTLNY